MSRFWPISQQVGGFQGVLGPKMRFFATGAPGLENKRPLQNKTGDLAGPPVQNYANRKLLLREFLGAVEGVGRPKIMK